MTSSSDSATASLACSGFVGQILANDPGNIYDDVRIVSRSGELTGEDVVPGFAMPLHDLWPDSHRDGP